MYDEGISSTGSLLDIAIDAGIIEKKGSWFSFNGEMIAQGREATRRVLRSDSELFKKIQDLVTEKVQVEIGETLGARKVESGID